MDLETLNKTQAAWMALQSGDTEAEKQRVYTLMRNQPKAHLSIPACAPDTANIYHSGPVWANARPLQEAIDYAEKAGIQTEFAWRTDGVWAAIEKKKRHFFDTVPIGTRFRWMTNIGAGDTFEKMGSNTVRNVTLKKKKPVAIQYPGHYCGQIAILD